MDEEALIEALVAEGFSSVMTVPIEANADAGEHTHDLHTVHIIVEGELIITDSDGMSRTYGVGERVEFPAGTTHKAKGGPTLGAMIVGVKQD